MADMKKLKLTPGEKKMGDALMMTKRGKQVMDAQKRMQEEKEKAGDAKRMRADKLLGISSNKKGGSIMKKSDKAGRALVKKSADTMGRAMMKKAGGGKCYAKGGSIDGVAKKGHTKAKQVKMAAGGMPSRLGSSGSASTAAPTQTALGNPGQVSRQGITLGNRTMAAPGRTLGNRMMRMKKGGTAKKGKC